MARPKLTIEYVETRNLGRCFNSTSYKITSIARLSTKTINALFDAGLLGCGQSFRISSQCDGKEEPAGYDEVPYKNYFGETRTRQDEYFEYKTETECDSGD